MADQGRGAGAVRTASIGNTSAPAHGAVPTSSARSPILPGAAHGDCAATPAAVPRVPRRALQRPYLVVWDVDCCLVQVHMWGTHRHKPLADIPIDDSLFPDASFFRRLVLALRQAGVGVALATFGRKDVATALAAHAMRERWDVHGGVGGAAVSGATQGAATAEDDDTYEKHEQGGVSAAAGRALSPGGGGDGASESVAGARPARTPVGTSAGDGTCTSAADRAAVDAAGAYFHRENVTSPIDFGCAEGTKALVNKDIQLRVLAQRAGIAETEFDHVLFFDDTVVNVEGAAAIGVSAHEARPFTQAVWEANGEPWCRRHGIELLLQSDAPAALHECGVEMGMAGFAASPLSAHQIAASGAGNSSTLSGGATQAVARATCDVQGARAGAEPESGPLADGSCAGTSAAATSTLSAAAAAAQSTGTAAGDEDISWV